MGLSGVVGPRGARARSRGVRARRVPRAPARKAGRFRGERGERSGTSEAFRDGGPGGRGGTPRGGSNVAGARSVPGAATFWRRCFADDLTFTQKFGFGMSTRVVDATTGEHLGADTTTDRRERRGIWTYSESTLRLEFEDGGEAEYAAELAGDDLLLGGQRWRRMSP